jgi:zinc protease
MEMLPLPRLLLILFAAAWLFGPIASYGSTPLSERVSEVVLPNGLKVILLENHKAPLATFQVWYRVGSRNEQWGKTGLSHILEHMMFDGTERTPGEEFSRIIEENGGDENAFTSNDFTAYFENMSAAAIHVAIPLEADRMQGALIRDSDFKNDRSVVMEERRLRTDDHPRAVLIEQLSATAFQTHPYHWPIIGWMEDIARITAGDLRAYYKMHYVPANAFLVVVGDFDTKEILPLIERAFGSIPAGAPPAQITYAEGPQMGERRVVVKREAQSPVVVKAYRVPNLTDPDSYVLEVIAALLSAGESARLTRALVREKQLALSADADNPLTSRDPNLFSLSADVVPGRSVEEAEKALEAEITRLQTEAVSAAELEKVKNQMEAAFTYGQDSLFRQGMLLATYEIASSWRDADRYVPAIRAVGADDVRRVAQKYLVPDNCTTGVLVPLPPKEKKPAAPDAPARLRTIQ